MPSTMFSGNRFFCMERYTPGQFVNSPSIARGPNCNVGGIAELQREDECSYGEQHVLDGSEQIRFCVLGRAQLDPARNGTAQVHLGTSDVGCI
jgi:hypothetical protein